MAGVLGTVALLGSGAAIAYMVMPQEDAPAPLPKAGAAAKGPKKTQPALTKAQKRARHDAVAKLAAEGYEPAVLADWRPGAPLKVLVGRSDSGAMRAFFFSGKKFVGYDDPATSNHVRVASARRNSVTLVYRLSTGSPEKVRFTWENGALQTSAPVPPSSVR
jgi:LppP/LprE lipoprotein